MSKQWFLWLKPTILLSIVFVLAGCLSESEDFDSLTNGDISEVEQTTISQALPDVAQTVIEVGATQQFFVTAEAPFGRTVMLTWKLDGTTVQSGTTANYSLVGTTGNIGSHSLEVEATDGNTFDSKTWSVKVNGPPVLTAISTGTQVVSVGSNIDITISATDPNGDDLTYTWLLNGATNVNLTGSGATGTLAGAEAIVGSSLISVQVNDGTATSSYTWTAEVNYFPMACNQLAQGEICTYGGNPSVGDATDPAVTQTSIRTGIMGTALDPEPGINNYFFSDTLNHIIWYWNRTNAAVTRLGITVPANQMVRVAGSGEQANGSEAIPALQSALNNPRGLWYNEVTDTLYIADYSNHKVRFVDSTGIVWNGMGVGGSYADAISVFVSDCNNPADIAFYSDNLYVTCYGSHRVRRWDLTSDTVYNVLGTGGSGYSGDGGDPLLAQADNPYGIYVDSDGIYVTHYDRHRVRFINHAGAQVTFFGSNTVGGVGPGFASQVKTIIGQGGASYDNAEKAPLSIRVGYPTDVLEKDGVIYVNTIYSNRDRIYAANNTGGLLSFGSRSVSSNMVGPITTNTTAGYNGSGIDLGIARVNNPYTLTYDSIENAFLMADNANRRLRKINLSSWEIETLVGSGWSRNGFIGDTVKPSMEHQFNYPSATAWDATNRTLFFMDKSNGRIRKIDPYGQISTALGKGTSDPIIDQEVPSNVYTRFANDYNVAQEHPALALFDDGNLVYSDRYILRGWNRQTANDMIAGAFFEPDRVATFAGDYLSGAGNGPDDTAINTLFDRPGGIAVLGSGSSRQIFYADTRNHCIKHIDNDGNVTTLVGNVDGSNHCNDTPGNGPNSSSSPLGYGLNDPSNVAVDTAGNVYIADRDNHKIRFLNRSAAAISIGTVTVDPGEIATIVCNSGTSGIAAENSFGPAVKCYFPMGLAVYESTFCFSNAYHHNVRCMDTSDGRVSTVAGSVTAAISAGAPFGLEQEGVAGTSARLRYPRGLSFDENGDLFIADTYNHIIRKLKLSP